MLSKMDNFNILSGESKFLKYYVKINKTIVTRVNAGVIPSAIHSTCLNVIPMTIRRGGGHFIGC